MNLINWKGNQIVVAPEAMYITALRNLWEFGNKKYGDAGGLMLFGVLYNIYDPRSEFQIETDEDERIIKVREETGVPEKWKPDKIFETAVTIYIKLTHTTSAKALQGNRKALAKVDDFLDDITITEDNMDKVLKAVALKNDLAVKIAQAEKEIYKDVEEYSAKARGKVQKTIGDDGLKQLFTEEV